MKGRGTTNDNAGHNYVSVILTSYSGYHTWRDPAVEDDVRGRSEYDNGYDDGYNRESRIHHLIAEIVLEDGQMPSRVQSP